MSASLSQADYVQAVTKKINNFEIFKSLRPEKLNPH